MRNPSGRPGRVSVRCLGLAIGLALLLPVLATGPAGASGYPPLGVSLDSSFLTNLSLPSVAPGGSTSLTFRMADPVAVGATLSAVVVSFEVYAFNGFPGNATAFVPVANAPVLANTTASGKFVTVAFAAIAPGASDAGSVSVVTSSDTPAGTFAIRIAVNFTLNASAYRLASRGWFTADQWANGTEAANGTAKLNLTALGNISGVVPETALLVSPGGWDIALAALLIGGLALVGAGAYVYFRRSPGSKSGAG
ncbi:MAG TPA: hypothetical protein VK455_03300 [Thermoplasmata archaeon]|nr:hypothetical protein [Thermoplasmata archaeon]